MAQWHEDHIEELEDENKKLKEVLTATENMRGFGFNGHIFDKIVRVTKESKS